MTTRVPTSRYRAPIWILAFAIATASVSTQTKIVAPKNGYKLSEDVKVGQEAAAEAKKELPMLNDERLDQYVETVGAKLVAAIPAEFQHSEFRYTFDVVNQKEINAFALPGGPMFLNRGMIEASKSEAEMAGVMAHEISHVALRHGTAQQSKAGLPTAIGGIGQVVGSILGGWGGAITSTVAQLGSGVWMTKYSREFESQADILGAQILARAGYDPREMANMFKTIEAEGGSSGPEWLSSHPNPGNRYTAINKEAQSLTVQGKAETGQFPQIQARLKGMSPALTAEQIAKAKKPGSAPGPTTAPSTRTVKVDPPSAQLRTVTPAAFMRVDIPTNWTAVSNKNSATYAPQGAVFQGESGQTFTHGIQFGTIQGTGNLQNDTRSLLESFARSNPELKRQSAFVRDVVDGRQALTGTLSNVSDVTGQPEQIAVTTTLLPDNNMLFIIGVAPQSEASAYTDTFKRVRQTVKLTTNR